MLRLDIICPIFIPYLRKLSLAGFWTVSLTLKSKFPAADLDSIRRERDFFKQQMEYFRQQLNVQLSRPPAAATGFESDRPLRPPLTRVMGCVLLYIV